MAWEIPYFQIEAGLAGAFVLALATIHLWRAVHSELRPRKCVFCGETVDAEEHPHHLEICGLMMLSIRGVKLNLADVQTRSATAPRLQTTILGLQASEPSGGMVTELPPNSSS